MKNPTEQRKKKHPFSVKSNFEVLRTALQLPHDFPKARILDVAAKRIVQLQTSPFPVKDDATRDVFMGATSPPSNQLQPITPTDNSLHPDIQWDDWINFNDDNDD